MADIGKVVDRLFVEHAAPVLKAHGFVRRSGPRHWRRIGEERVDLVDLHRSTVVRSEVAQLRVELLLHVPRLQALHGSPPERPEKVTTGYPLSLFAPGMDRLEDLWAHDGMDPEAFGAELRLAVETGIAVLDAIDVTTEEGLVAAAQRYFRAAVPLAHAAFGNADAARRALIDGATRPRRFDPPDTGPHPGDVRTARLLGMDPADLPATPVGGFVDRDVVIAALREALPGVFQSALPRGDRLVVRLLRATDEEVARAHEVAGDVGLDVLVSPLDPTEIGAAVRALQVELLDAERRRPELIAVVRSWTAFDVAVETYDLDDETDALIRRHLPDAARTSWPAQRPMAVLERADRHRRRRQVRRRADQAT